MLEGWKGKEREKVLEKEGGEVRWRWDKVEEYTLVFIIKM